MDRDNKNEHNMARLKGGVMGVKKGIIFLFGLTLIISNSAWSIQAVENKIVRPYGIIVSQDSTKIPHAVVEKIKLFSPLSSDSDERIERNGTLVRYPDAESTILICHGFMCDRFEVACLRSIFPKKKCNIMTFDFRAHGENPDGQFCTFGRDEALDVQTAARFLREHPELQDKPLVVYGFSMGAVASIEAQSQDTQLFDGMILDCPFDSSKNLIKKGLNNMKFKIFGQEFNIPGRETLERYAFHPYVQSFLKVVLKAVARMDTKNICTNICPVSPKKSVRNIAVPCFFIHCKNDELVPVDAVKKVYERAQGYKTLWVTAGKRHFDSYFSCPELYSQKVKMFLKGIINDDLDQSLNGVMVEDA